MNRLLIASLMAVGLISACSSGSGSTTAGKIKVTSDKAEVAADESVTVTYSNVGGSTVPGVHFSQTGLIENNGWISTFDSAGNLFNPGESGSCISEVNNQREVKDLTSGSSCSITYTTKKTTAELDSESIVFLAQFIKTESIETLSQVRVLVNKV